MTSIDQLRSGQPLETSRTNQNDLHSTLVKEGSSREVLQPRSDAFSISDQSRAIEALNQQMANEIHFDSTKVAAIKAAITNGVYKVNADKLATNIMKYEDEIRSLK
ncbi:flagellar biosynthesis anti-sigma factor FlgM [Candidatus Enterovibrio escicola]|uniref:Negative regulator of flagellin synthesis n=1 Tax=Candidatus Enterovibrio escicola TaxID=1927127 RepID=A0A2A5T1B4_9GAMM|nr:flagellar biosynthesis anti-sigma factor FlgM [Candidatus Enterovibrio escacola]PCS21959.1 Negative regulator of flagellin synthesis FlgM [Candidatus Enterovibrio escacola]